MEKPVCMFTAVIFLGVALDTTGALIVNATTEGYSLTTTATVNWTESVTVEDYSRHQPTPTTAQAKLFTSAVTGKQLGTKNTSNKEGEETDDRKTDEEKTGLGKKSDQFKHLDICQVCQLYSLREAERSQRDFS